MPGRTVILSDLHLGRPYGAVSSAAALRRLWDGADRLVINGDVAEVHHPRHWALAARETLHLFDLCERDGVELTLLSGNHDPFISDLRCLHLAGGQVFVTHGDVLHPAISPWSPAAARIRRAHARALAALEPEVRDGLEARLAASQHAGFAEWSDRTTIEREAARSTLRGMLLRPWILLKVLAYWRAAPALAAAFAARHAPQATAVVLGHTHRPGVWTVEGRVVVNTGSFGFPGRPLAVTVEDRTLAVVPVRRRDGVYTLDPRPRARYHLPDPAASAPASSLPPTPAAAPGAVLSAP